MSRPRAFAHAFLRDCRGASAAEFVLVLPLLVLLVFATIDAGWYAWQINLAEKATQAGARMAVVTDPVASGLTTESYNTATYGLTQGDTIPASALGLLTCNGSTSTCSCTTAPCPSSLTFSNTPFQAIVTRMKAYDPAVAAANVVVEYRGSGLGYAGDPSGMQIAPLVTVRLQNMQMNALSSFVWKAAINLPDFAYSLTMEDGSGTRSN
jgi:Flp pilus assembly protein TadG